MRLFGTTLIGAGFLGAAMAAAAPAMDILEYDIESAYTKFQLSTSLADELTNPLVFELQVNPVQDDFTSDITLNDHSLPVHWTRNNEFGEPVLAVAQSHTHSLSAKDSRGYEHSFNLSLSADLIVPHDSSFPDHVTQRFVLQIGSIDGVRPINVFGFSVTTQPTAASRLKKLAPLHMPGVVDFDDYFESFRSEESMYDVIPVESETLESEDDFDIEAEIESLLLLESQAGDLRTQIAAKKQRIALRLKTHRERVSLQHLLEQCDGIMCAAKVIAQRICDKVGLVTEPSFGYAVIADQQAQHLITLESDEKRPQQNSRNSTKASGATPANHVASGKPALLPLSDSQTLTWGNPPGALIRVLEIIATGLGLVALMTFVRRKCMSPRTRAERAADREERKTARAYRRAARRALMRRRWDAFVTAISCFRQQDEEPRRTNYDEKRALILQDAFLEQDLDHAEKGEVMEAEIRELRHAHQIVSSLVRVDESQPNLATPVRDPPPTLVPLPYTPNTAASRSRASTGTLPSYTSESLPGYTSRLATEIGSSQNSDDGNSLRTHTTSSSEHGLFSRSTTHYDGSDSRNSRSTPSSSVIDVSTRPSEDTLRTLRFPGC